jgi:transcriptional regulator GlxA family with amidase domain
VLIPPIFNDIEQTLAQEAGLVSWLASFPANSKLLASSCTGAFLLAEAGILDGRRVTTNPAFGVLFQQRYPGVRLALDERIVDDNMVICAGATTAYLNLAIHVIDRLAGHDLAVSTAKALSIDRNPESQRPYFLFIAPKDHGDDKVLRLQTWIEVHHRDPISIDDMVDAAGMSVRNLNRRFLSATAMSPRQYLRRVGRWPRGELRCFQDSKSEARASEVRGAVAMNAASASRSAGGMVRPSFERRHRMSSGKRAHSHAMR